MKNEMKTSEQLKKELDAVKQEMEQAKCDMQQAVYNLTKERNLLRTLIDSVPDHLYIKDKAGQYFILVNKATARYLGIETPKEVVGKTDFDFFSEDAATQFRATEREALQSGQAILNFEEKNPWATSSTPKWFLETKIPLVDDSGKVTGFVGVNHDIIDFKNLEATLKQAHDELEKRVEERTTKLIEANKALKHEVIERQQVDLEIIQRNFQLFVLQSAGAAMASSLDLKQVLYTIMYEITRLLDVEGCEISDWDQIKDTIVTIAGYSGSPWWTEARFEDIYNLSDYPLMQEVLIDQVVGCQNQCK